MIKKKKKRTKLKTKILKAVIEVRKYQVEPDCDGSVLRGLNSVIMTHKFLLEWMIFGTFLVWFFVIVAIGMGLAFVLYNL